MKKESVPFAVINVVDAGKECHLYWSKNSGVMGHQVIGQIYDNNAMKFQWKTSGCGFCKQSDALDTFVEDVLGNRMSYHDRPSEVLRDSCRGGNYYELTREELRKAVMR